MESKIVEIAKIKVFRKCHPINCQYCKFEIDLCSWLKTTCPNCGSDFDSIPLNSKLSDISSIDENIRT